MSGIVAMRGLAHRKVTWLSAVTRISYSDMSPTRTSNAVTETVSLLEGRPQKRCCCGRYRVNGSDGVWSWVVASANFLVNFIIVGLGRMSGILYVDFMHIFNIDRKTASIPFSVQQAGRNLFGPLAGILGQKYGIRAVTILGGAMGSLSAVLIYFKMDITSITLLWGVLYGASAAFTTTLNQVSIDQYFERNRATAGGFAFSGGCVGAFFFPVILETLITDYGMKGTFLVLGAILLNVIPAAMMLAERNNEADKSYMQNIAQYGAFEVGEPAHAITAPSDGQKTNPFTVKARQIGTTSHGIDFGILQDNSDIVFRLLTIEVSDESIRSRINQSSSQDVDKLRLLNDLECVYSSVANPGLRQENLPSIYVLLDAEKKSTQSNPDQNDSSVASNGEETNEGDSQVTTDKDKTQRVYIENKLHELYEMRGTRIISRFHYPDQPRACRVLIELRKLYEKLTEEPSVQSVCNKAQYFASSSPPEEAKESPVQLSTQKHSNSFLDHMKTAVKLHSNPLFLLICVCRGVFMLTFIPVVTIIVDFSMDQGLQKYDGKYAIGALSLGDFLGRLCLGWITDRGYLTLPRYMLVAMILLGGSTASLPLLHTKACILSAILLFGVLQGSLFVKHPMLVSQYMESHEQSIGMGFINFLSGLLGFALPAFIGYFRDTLGSYNKLFYINGIICALVGLLWALEPLLIQAPSSTEPEKSKERHLLS